MSLQWPIVTARPKEKTPIVKSGTLAPHDNIIHGLCSLYRLVMGKKSQRIYGAIKLSLQNKMDLSYVGCLCGCFL